MSASSRAPPNEMRTYGRPIARAIDWAIEVLRSEEHTSELQSLAYLVCRLLLGKKEHTSELQSLAYLVCRLLLEKKKHTSELQSLAYHVCRLLLEKKTDMYTLYLLDERRTSRT